MVLFRVNFTSLWKMGQSGDVVVWPRALELTECIGDLLQLWHLWASLFFLLGQSRERWFWAQYRQILVFSSCIGHLEEPALWPNSWHV